MVHIKKKKSDLKAIKCYSMHKSGLIVKVKLNENIHTHTPHRGV